ncbi:MAG TPA: DUF3015 family protein [Macromonas sp.]|nr:DUF3015 family protein [Macromonas sp.]
MKKAMVVTAVLMGASFAAQAQDKTPGSGPNPYVDCGIGAALFQDTHWAAVTSNVIWDLGTTAITSATSSPETCSRKKVAAAMFINDTYERLAEETSRGEGEHLTTVMNIMECSPVERVAAIEATRTSMGAVVSQPGYAAQPRIEKASQFFNAVQSAAKNCAA